MSTAVEALPAIDLLGLTRPQLAEALAPVIDRPFRVEQIYRALYERGVHDFAAMTDLSKDLRDRLAERYRIGLPEIAERRPSSDGTCKYLFRLPGLSDTATIEAVDIPDGGRRTFCLSSQAGCALACTFCVTGYWGAGRNLTAGEIVAQVLAIRADRDLPADGLNLVFMGMGEPLLNLENLETALAILTESISPHRITVSTVGILPGLEAMARWERRPNLAISLHAPDEERRSQVMPINRTYPLAELMPALRRFPLEKGRKITFEYVLIRGFNDAPRDADLLVKLLNGVRAKVNLIPINPDPVLGDAMVPPDDATVERFKERLRQKGLIATVRKRRGDDVSAACGQLRAFGRDPRGVLARRK
jgi:23S rRNA (adenine2503-C2)-methyltransferase